MLSSRPIARLAQIAVGLLVFSFSTFSEAEVLFTDVTEQAGLAGTGAVNFSWADYDNDGDPDLLVGCSRLFRNDGAPDYGFTDVTAEAGLGGNHGTWADIDNDGDLDLYCAARNQSARLWENAGDGTFVEITDFDGDGTRDMTVDSPSITGAWADFDLDGFVDMYVGNYERTGNADCDIDTLWKNDGDKTFTDVTTASGIEAGEGAIVNADPGMCARGVTWGDYNNDGWADIYVSDYRLDQNMLFENQGDGTFV
ncbi:MAG: VCBS repeat-containing protein [Acidobacteriota bacterium]|nr:MAG: VCBS repeat-containing protein [Acidobacteriota bacterium]